MRKNYFILIALILVSISSKTSANSIQGNQVIVDRGTYFTDAQSSLDWLKLSQTYGLSPNQMSALLSPGGLYQDWRYASADEITQLLNNLPASDNSRLGRSVETSDIWGPDSVVGIGSNISWSKDKLFDLVNTFGIFYDDDYSVLSKGMYYAPDNTIWSLTFGYFDLEDVDLSFMYSGGLQGLSADDVGPWDGGQFLVRSSFISVDFSIRAKADGNVLINNSNQVTAIIRGSDALDVKAINTATLVLDSAAIRLRGNREPHCRVVDANQDQYPDLECRFKDDTKQWNTGTADVSLNGALRTGEPISGTSSVTFIRK